MFGGELLAFTGLHEEALIDWIASSVVARLPTPPKPQAQGEKRYVREKEAAAFLGVSVHMAGVHGVQGVAAVCRLPNFQVCDEIRGPTDGPLPS